jgi:hypothetical protein
LLGQLDDRFTHYYFGSIPSSLLDTAYTEVTQHLNRQSLSSAYSALISYNKDLTEKGTPAKLEDFLPYPVVIKKDKASLINTSTLNYLRKTRKICPCL